MWRTMLACGFGLLCLVGFRHAYRPPALPGCVLQNARMASAHLPGVDFRHVNLSGSDLAGAELVEARLESADLSNTNMSATNLRQADLTGANLRGANMMGANLTNALLEGAVYDQHTTWPEGFAPESAGARFQQSPRTRVPSRRYGAALLAW